jgi:hypothetical protein
MKFALQLACVSVVMFALVTAVQANTVTFTFGGTDSDATSILNTNSSGSGFTRNQNTGGESNLYFSATTTSTKGAGILLFKVTLPDDIAGATINSAVLTLKETNWNGFTMNNIEVHRVNMTTGSWAVGNGTVADCWTGQGDAGAGMYFADFDPVTQTGLNWSGNVTTGSSAATNLFSNTSAFGELVSTNASWRTGSTTTFDLTSWVQNIANGTWDNDGFAIWSGNSTLTANDSNASNDFMVISITGMTIDYTPCPEPATITLLVIGGLAMIRRSRRVA